MTTPLATPARPAPRRNPICVLTLTDSAGAVTQIDVSSASRRVLSDVLALTTMLSPRTRIALSVDGCTWASTVADARRALATAGAVAVKEGLS